MEDSEFRNLLIFLIRLMGRLTFPEERLREIVAPARSSPKSLPAYNLCDGTRTQAEICRKLRWDRAQLSKAVSRWEDAGVLHRLGGGRDVRPAHIYPLPQEEGPHEKPRKGK